MLDNDLIDVLIELVAESNFLMKEKQDIIKLLEKERIKKWNTKK